MKDLLITIGGRKVVKAKIPDDLDIDDVLVALSKDGEVVGVK